MKSYAIQERAVSENPDNGPQGKGWQEDIAFTLEARNKVQAVCGVPEPHAANDNAPINTGSPLRFLSVCSGIEAASVAWHPLGWRAVAFSEIEKFPSAVLAHHYPDVPNLGDFTKIDTTTLGRVDILAGGTPCQAFSVAGLRKGLDDARGNLTLKFVELAHALADGNGLRNVVWENVVGVLSDKGNAFGCFLGGLVGADAPVIPPGRWTNAGMVSGPRGRAAWRVLDAQYFGVAQRRRRVIVVADFGSGADPAAVLLIEQGLPRHPPARGEKGKDVAPTISARTKGGGGLGTDFDLDGGLVRVPEITRCVTTREGSSQDYETTTMVAVGVNGDIAHTLKAEGADDSEDGTGRGTPVIATATSFAWQSSFADQGSEDVSGTLIKNQTMAVAMTVAIRGRDGGATAELGGEVATALRASQGGGDKPHVLAFADVAPTIKRDYGKGYGDNEMDGGGLVGQLATSAVRRLTPRECERLQGFQWQCSPDYPGAWQDDAGRWWSPDYTNIPYRGRMAADGPRYKALGNSWAVPKFVWLGKRIAKYMPANDNATTKDAA